METKFIPGLLLVLGAAFLAACSWQAPTPTQPSASLPVPGAGATAYADDGSLRRAIDARADEVPVNGRGTVVRLLSDDREGNPHQRILVRVAGGGTVLIAHNIALSPRVAPLAVGDELEFAGDYAWNDKGGVVHWTHHDPQGRHRTGWVRRVR